MRKYSTRSILAILTGSELTVMFLAKVRSLPIVELVDLIAGSVIVGTLVTSITEFSPKLEAVGLGIQLCLMGYVVYITLPKIIPERTGPWAEQPIIGVTFAIGCLGASLTQNSLSKFASITIIAALVIILFIFLTEEAPLDNNGSIYRLLMTAAGADEERIGNPPEHVDYDRILEKINDFLGIVAVGGLFALSMGITGMLIRTFSKFFPLLELMTLGWVLFPAISNRFSKESQIASESDIEGDLIGLIALMFENLTKGLSTVMMVTTGLFVGAIPFVYILRVLPTLGSFNIDSFWAYIGATTVLLFGFLLYGAHSLWYWWRTAKRLPAHFRWIRDEEATTEVVSPSFATLPGAAIIIPTTFGFLAGGLFLSTKPSVTYLPPWLSVFIALAMLPGVFLTLLSLYKTRKRKVKKHPQSPATEHRILPVAFTIQLGTMAFFLGVTTNYNSLKTSGLNGVKPLELVGGIEPIIIILLLPSIYYVQDLTGNIKSDRTNRYYKRQLAFYLGCLVVLPSILFVMGVKPVMLGIFTMGIAVIVGLGVYDVWNSLSKLDENTQQ